MTGQKTLKMNDWREAEGCLLICLKIITIQYENTSNLQQLLKHSNPPISTQVAPSHTCAHQKDLSNVDACFISSLLAQNQEHSSIPRSNALFLMACIKLL